MAEVVGSTPPASNAEAAKNTSGANPAGQDLGLLEVECREALRTQWLSFPFQPGETAATTLARCRFEASMVSLDTLAVWPDGGELDLTLTLEESLRPDERRLLATGPAVVPESAEPPRTRKPITSEDTFLARHISLFESLERGGEGLGENWGAGTEESFYLELF